MKGSTKLWLGILVTALLSLVLIYSHEIYDFFARIINNIIEEWKLILIAQQLVSIIFMIFTLDDGDIPSNTNILWKVVIFSNVLAILAWTVIYLVDWVIIPINKWADKNL